MIFPLFFRHHVQKSSILLTDHFQIQVALQFSFQKSGDNPDSVLKYQTAILMLRKKLFYHHRCPL